MSCYFRPQALSKECLQRRSLKLPCMSMSRQCIVPTSSCAWMNSGSRTSCVMWQCWWRGGRSVPTGQCWQLVASILPAAQGPDGTWAGHQPATEGECPHLAGVQIQHTLTACKDAPEWPALKTSQKFQLCQKRGDMRSLKSLHLLHINTLIVVSLFIHYIGQFRTIISVL